MNWKIGIGGLLLSAGMTTAHAANPFADVTPQDWAYQAVAGLAAAGIVDGYPDGTFHGERNITRYEMAQMVARAMTKEDQMDAAQKAELDRLEKEFGGELKSLGVRVSNLEEKVSRVKFSGDARLAAFSQQADMFKGGDKDSRMEARIRLRAMANLSKDTMVLAMLESNASLNGHTIYDHNYNEIQDQLRLSQLFAYHKFNGTSLTLGRFPVSLGTTGVFYDDTFSGLAFTFGKPEGAHFTAAYGRVDNLQMDFVRPMLWAYGIKDRHDLTSDFKPESYYLEMAYEKQRKISAKAFLLQPSGKTGEVVQVIGAGLSVWPHKFVNIHGDYILNNKYNMVNNQKPHMWMAGVSFGIAHPFYPKSFQIGVDYMYTEAGSNFGGSKYDVLKPYLNPMMEVKGLQNRIQTKAWVPAELQPVLKAGIYKNMEAQFSKQGSKLPGYYYDMILDQQYEPRVAPVLGQDGKPVMNADGTPKIQPVIGKDGKPIIDKTQNYTFTHGGAKVWMLSAKYVPMKNLLLEAYYAFGAKTLNGEKLDNNYRLQATYYF